MMIACGRYSAWMCCAKRARSDGSARLANASRQRGSCTSDREVHALRAHDAAHAQVELQIARQALDLRRELIEQHAADDAGPMSPTETVCGER
jgi:hypothetical protein